MVAARCSQYAGLDAAVLLRLYDTVRGRLRPAARPASLRGFRLKHRFCGRGLQCAKLFGALSLVLPAVLMPIFFNGGAESGAP